MLRSIRSQIFIACLALTLVAVGVGTYGFVSINRAGQLAINMYDRPLMAINFARLASFVFAQMNGQILQARLNGSATPGSDVALTNSARDFFDDLDIAKQRTQSTGASAAIDNIDRDATRWNELRQSSAPGATAEMDKLAQTIVRNFDVLTELTAEDGFIEREKASKALDAYRVDIIVATGVALLATIVITALLARRILHPLSSAASVANRIAGGEFETEIPSGGADETGTLLRSMTVMQANIRMMMEREAAQRRSAQNRLVDAIEGSREGLVLIGQDDRILIANSQMAAFFPSIADTLHAEASFKQTLLRARERPAAIVDDRDWFASLTTDGEVQLSTGRWLRISESATQEGGKFLFFSDISPLKEREVSLNAARQAAEAANVAKSNFLATMGHELRTPLNAVIGFSEMIAGEQLGPLGNASYVEYAGDVVASARHLLAIINDVLELSKSTDGKLRLDAELVDMMAIVHDCERIFSDRCTEVGLKFRAELDPAAHFVLGDEEKLRHVVSNLLSNAVKFSPQGGSITVASRALSSGGMVLSITDTGIGMRPEDIPKALEPFGQIDSALARRYDGTGLGLPLSKALVELHGGKLEIKSALGQGTTVTITLKTATPDLSRGETMSARRA